MNEREARRSALRLIAYIQITGVEPVPFEHENYRSYVASLQRQYGLLRAAMSPEAQRLTTIAGRALVSSQGLEWIAANSAAALPLQLDSQSRAQGGTVLTRHPKTGGQESAFPKKEWNAQARWNCNRKLRHPHYLSAWLHAARLGEPGLECYPCPVCGGIHVGHRKGLGRITGQIKVLNTKIAGLESQRDQLGKRRDELLEQ